MRSRREAARIAALQVQHVRSVRLAEPNSRTRTIARLIATYRAHHGVAPSAEWIAGTLAISVERVRKHLALLKP